MLCVSPFSLGRSHWHSLMFWVRFSCAGFIKIPRKPFFPGRWHLLNRPGGNCYLHTTHVKTQKLSGPGRGQRAVCSLREGGACHSRRTCTGASQHSRRITLTQPASTEARELTPVTLKITENKYFVKREPSGYIHSKNLIKNM